MLLIFGLSGDLDSESSRIFVINCMVASLGSCFRSLIIREFPTITLWLGYQNVRHRATVCGNIDYPELTVGIFQLEAKYTDQGLVFRVIAQEQLDVCREWRHDSL